MTQHDNYADTGHDNLMVLLDRNLTIDHEIGCCEIDNFLTIQSSPDMWAEYDRHAAMFRHTH